MKIPRQIKIGSIAYDVVRLLKLESPEDGGVLGRIVFVPQEIQLRNGQKEDREAQTLLHEILHGINNEHRLWSSEDEEEVCCRLSALLLSVIRNNNLDFRVPEAV